MRHSPDIGGGPSGQFDAAFEHACKSAPGGWPRSHPLRRSAILVTLGGGRSPPLRFQPAKVETCLSGRRGVPASDSIFWLFPFKRAPHREIPHEKPGTTRAASVKRVIACCLQPSGRVAVLHQQPAECVTGMEGDNLNAIRRQRLGHRHPHPRQRHSAVVQRQAVELRSKFRSKPFQLVECALLLERLGIALKRNRRAENPGTAA